MKVGNKMKMMSRVNLKMIRQWLYVWIVILLVACKPSVITDSKKYFTYLADPDNGLVKEKTIAGIRYRLKYLPADYLAYTTIGKTGGYSLRAKDSVMHEYDHSITFMLNIGPSDREEFDLTRLNVSNYEEFADRIEQMSFHAQDWISLKGEHGEHHPVLVRMENINALEKSRNFIVVFNSEKNTNKDLRKNDLCFTYTDELFNTGINKFIFKTGDLEAVPDFKF